MSENKRICFFFHDFQERLRSISKPNGQLWTAIQPLTIIQLQTTQVRCKFPTKNPWACISQRCKAVKIYQLGMDSLVTLSHDNKHQADQKGKLRTKRENTKWDSSSAKDKNINNKKQYQQPCCPSCLYRLSYTSPPWSWMSPENDETSSEQNDGHHLERPILLYCFLAHSRSPFHHHLLRHLLLLHCHPVPHRNATD